MRGRWIFPLTLPLAFGGLALAQPRWPGGYGGRMEPGMMGRPRIGSGMMRDDLGCPMLMGLLSNADYYLSYREELELSKNQVRSLEKIRDASEKGATRGMADLRTAMLDLRNLLKKDQVDLTEAETLNKRGESP